MRKIYPLILFSLISLCLRAQDLTIKGDVTVQPDGLIFVAGSVKIDNGATLDIQSNGATHGKVQVNAEAGSYTNGYWECNGTTNSTNTAAATPNSTGEGEVHFLGDVNYYDIKGTSVAFPNLIINVGSVTGGFSSGKVNIIDSINVMRSLDLQSGGRLITSANKVVYISNSAPDAIKSTVDGIGGNRSNYIQGSLRREVVIGATNYYKFPIGVAPSASSILPSDVNYKRGYNPAFVDLRTSTNPRKPANATSIVASFVDFADPGTIHHNQLAHSCYSTSTQYQYLELFWMVKGYGYWDLKPNGNPAGWDYDFYVKPDLTRIFNYNHGLTHMKVIKAPRSFTVSSNADWSPYVEESGDGCDMVNVYNNNIYWKPGPNPPTPYPYSLTDSIRASGLITFSRFGLSGGLGAGLPIEWLWVKAYPVNNNFIRVDWATATEINNSGFEVLRRTDGTNFETIGWVDGAGNSSSQRNYIFDDMNVVPNQLYYYRLKQVDFDGTVDFSEIRTAMITSSTTFTISEFIPNPAQNNSRVEVTTTDDMNMNVTVYDTLGQIMTRGDHHLVSGKNQIDFDFNLLADGTYFAIFQANNEVFNRKLILTK